MEKQTEKDLTQEIIEAATEVFAREGLKFKMQEVAELLHISKKTIYTQFESKEELLLAMLDEGFARIHEKKRALLSSDLPPREKLREVMIALPDEYSSVDFRQLDHLNEKYPLAAKRLADYLDNGWENVETLIEQGEKEGWLRKGISVPILKTMFSATLQSFLMDEQLEKQGIGYAQALDAMMDLLMLGMLEK